MGMDAARKDAAAMSGVNIMGRLIPGCRQQSVEEYQYIITPHFRDMLDATGS